MKKLKRLLAMALSVVMLLSCIPTSISAASGTIYYDSSSIQYGTEFSFTNPYGDGFPGAHNWNSSTHVSYIHVNDGIGYCIQPGIRIGDGPGDKVTYIGGSSTSYYSKMSEDLRAAIELAKLYGYPNKISNKNGYYATQVLIWGLIIGQVDPVDFTGTNKFYTCLNSDSKDAIKTYYDQLLNDLKNHHTVPSFAGKLSAVPGNQDERPVHPPGKFHPSRHAGGGCQPAKRTGLFFLLPPFGSSNQIPHS